MREQSPSFVDIYYTLLHAAFSWQDIDVLLYCFLSVA